VSTFEFILVSLAIILGFGISEILSGWGEQMRHRREVRPSLLQVAASAYVLFASLRYLWLLWGARNAQWTFAGYLLTALPALCLALAAYVVRADPTSLRRSLAEQYFDVARPFHLLLAAVPSLAALDTALHVTELRRLGAAIANPFVWTVWPIFITAFLTMAWSRSPRIHGVAWTLVWLTAGTTSALVAPTLGTGP
jgi:hypothetical protein